MRCSARHIVLGRLSAVLFACTAFTGCPVDPAPANDAGDVIPNLDGGLISDPRDAGSDAGSALVDAGGQDAGTGLSNAERSELLCAILARGAALAAATSAPPPRCSPDDDIDDPAASGDDVDIGTTCLPGSPLYDETLAALEAGRIAVDLEKVETCLAAARAARQQHSTWGERDARLAALAALLDDSACETALVPLQGAGAPCVETYECQGQLRCEADPPSSGQKRCLTPAAVNTSCAEGPPGHAPIRSCAAGLACFNDLCVERRGEGQPCAADQVPCREDLACGASGVCAVPAAALAACIIDADCAAPSRCLNATCTPPHDDGEACGEGAGCAAACSLCRPLEADAGFACAPPAGAGEHCASTAQCALGLFCDAAGTCQGELGFGAVCDPATVCAAGLTCSRDVNATAVDGGVLERTCRSPAAVGSACAEGARPCVAGSCVDGVCVGGFTGDPCASDQGCVDDGICVVGMCQLPPRVGAPCAADGRCADALFCDGARCRELPAAGEMCAPGNRCDAAAYCDDGGVCAPRGAAGAVCANDGQCLSGACLLSGTCGAETSSCAGGDRGLTGLFMLGVLWPLGALRRRRSKATTGT